MATSGSAISKTGAIVKGTPVTLVDASGNNFTFNDSSGNEIDWGVGFDVVVTLKAVENDLWVATYSSFSPPSFGTAGINDTNITPGSPVNAYYLKQGEVDEFRLSRLNGDFLYVATGQTGVGQQSIYSYYAVAVRV